MRGCTLYSISPPCTLHNALRTLHPAPCILRLHTMNPAPNVLCHCILYPPPRTLHTALCTLHPASFISHTLPSPRNSGSHNPGPGPQTLHSAPCTPQPAICNQALHTAPGIRHHSLCTQGSTSIILLPEPGLQHPVRSKHPGTCIQDPEQGLSNQQAVIHPAPDAQTQSPCTLNLAPCNLQTTPSILHLLFCPELSAPCIHPLHPALRTDNFAHSTV